MPQTQKIDRSMKDWHKFFARAEFPLTFSDRDRSSLQLSANTRSREDPNPPRSYLTPEGWARFRFIAVDQNDYTKGYKIYVDNRYVSNMGSYERSNCLNTSADPKDASVYMPVFTGPQTFFIRHMADGRLLTRPWDRATSGIHGRKAILLAGQDAPGWDGIQQVFKMPLWPARILQMAYLALGRHFYLKSGNRVLYASNNNLAWGEVSDPSAIAWVSAPNPSSVHAGYVLSVGGKYIRMVGTDQPITLVDNINQATHLCPILSDDNKTLSFWHSESDHVLTIKDDLPVFSLLEDTQVIPPSWAVVPHDPHVALSGLGETKTLNDTVYLKQIAGKLTRDVLSKRGTTWDYSFNNILPDDWLIATPENAFGRYSDFEMSIPQAGANDFSLKPCDGSAPDPRHPCVSLISSVNAPGGTPLRLHAGHSRRIYEEMYKLIISGNNFIDILSLLRKDDTPSGEFLAAIRNAITYLSLKPEARNITIRFLFGEPLGWLGETHWIKGTGPYKPAADVLGELIRDIPSFTNSRMKIYIAYTSSVPLITWNHAKIIAVDGERALVGGHNMWAGPYLGENPVLDVSMKLSSGKAAVDAHHFADNLWFLQVNSHGDYWIDDAASYVAPSTRARAEAAVPPPRLFNNFYSEPADDPSRKSGTGVPILSAGREEGTAAGAAASDKALIALLDAATETIYISAQALSHDPIYPRYWPDDFLTSLAEALKRGVHITIFMSDPSGGAYKGDPPAEVIDKVRNKITGKTGSEITLLLNNLSVRSFPSASTWGLAAGQPGISNHAKVIMVDKKAFSIGSQNYYPCYPATLSEFTYFVEESVKAMELYTNYFQKMEAWALPAPPLPEPPVDRASYHISIVQLICHAVSSGGSDDQCYIKKNGTKIWPVSSKYTVMRRGSVAVFADINLPPMTVLDNEMVLELFEWDQFSSDDHLGDFRFHPHGNITYYDGTTYVTKWLSELETNKIYVMNGNMVDDDAQYTMAFRFTKTTL